MAEQEKWEASRFAPPADEELIREKILCDLKYEDCNNDE